ncbi:hypothetical protein FVEN_g5195 [Fusarium venenatum]|uniref:NAD dependent epimerase/dehydratase n=1 Tax=Fusarium venenatum TaxID=56646 RepID=A0A2L2TE39_9HYPO|nr:uncharacterized protein FVRRES_07103 [Fusarium venenatum]KAG8357113.1 hypothetical protein FVEN_g5195 [Fusarium venenatum]KAH6994050.1 hypothetical protein EDB82DRAFT_500582 [Fusarium venenatum]CEI62667.1 unnamed protein product [Fusarium venenatum]
MSNSNFDGEFMLSDSLGSFKMHELDNIKPHPITGRLIDSYPVTRTKPMRVLCLGQSRTGTSTLFAALKQLGYTPYYMSIAIGSPRTNFRLWREALDAKFHGRGKPWGRQEFDKILGLYDAVLEIPAICFVEELVAAYPEAKVIVTQYDVDSWLRSMDSTGGRVLRWPLWDTLASWDSLNVGPFWEFSKKAMPASFGTMTDFSTKSPARKAFHDHYELVRRMTPVDKTLEYHVEEGWGPLCKFLDKSVPDGKFPRIDDSKTIVLAHKMMWWMAFSKMVGKGSLASAVAGVFTSMIALWRLRYAVNVVAMLRPVGGFS